MLLLGPGLVSFFFLRMRSPVRSRAPWWGPLPFAGPGRPPRSPPLSGPGLIALDATPWRPAKCASEFLLGVTFFAGFVSAVHGLGLFLFGSCFDVGLGATTGVAARGELCLIAMHGVGVWPLGQLKRPSCCCVLTPPL